MPSRHGVQLLATKKERNNEMNGLEFVFVAGIVTVVTGIILIIFKKEYQGIMCKLGMHNKKVLSMGTWLCGNENCQKMGTRERDKKTGKWKNK